MASASTRPAKRARVDRSTQIINQAAELFRERGYARTSLKAVAERLNLTEPALYYYFPSKERLLYRIVYETLDHANAELKEIAADAELTPPQKMDRVVHVIVNTAVERLDMFTAYYKEKGNLTGELARKVARKEREHFEAIRTIYLEGVAKGAFDSADPDVAVFAVLGASCWTYTWYDPKGKLRAPEIATIISRMVLEGLRVNGSRP